MPTKELVKSINELVRERIQKRIEDQCILNDSRVSIDEIILLGSMKGIKRMTEKSRLLVSLSKNIKQN